jgi:hypothetical protein
MTCCTQGNSTLPLSMLQHESNLRQLSNAHCPAAGDCAAWRQQYRLGTCCTSMLKRHTHHSSVLGCPAVLQETKQTKQLDFPNANPKPRERAP